MLDSRLNVTIICLMLPSSFINWVWMLLVQNTGLSKEPYTHKTKQNQLGYKANGVYRLTCYIL